MSQLYVSYLLAVAVILLCLGLIFTHKRINILSRMLEDIENIGRKSRLCITCSRKMIYPLKNTCCWDCQNRLFIDGEYGHYRRSKADKANQKRKKI